MCTRANPRHEPPLQIIISSSTFAYDLCRRWPIGRLPRKKNAIYVASACRVSDIFIPSVSVNDSLIRFSNDSGLAHDRPTRFSFLSSAFYFNRICVAVFRRTKISARDSRCVLLFAESAGRIALRERVSNSRRRNDTLRVRLGLFLVFRYSCESICLSKKLLHMVK